MKEHSVIRIFPQNESINEKYFNLTKINLLQITKQSGLIITAFKNSNLQN